MRAEINNCKNLPLEIFLLRPKVSSKAWPLVELKINEKQLSSEISITNLLFASSGKQALSCYQLHSLPLQSSKSAGSTITTKCHILSYNDYKEDLYNVI